MGPTSILRVPWKLPRSFHADSGFSRLAQVFPGWPRFLQAVNMMHQGVIVGGGGLNVVQGFPRRTPCYLEEYWFTNRGSPGRLRML